MPSVTGIVRYDPRVRTPQGEVFDPWWLILEYDTALLERWRKVAEEEHGIRLSYPRWRAHITVVSGEIPRNRKKWGFRDGEEVRFTYTARIQTDGIFFWLPVRCDKLLDLRAALGLPRNPRRALHMTLGRVKR